MFFEHFWDDLPYPVILDARRFSVLNVARIYRYHESHANHVRFLAGGLFEQSQHCTATAPPSANCSTTWAPSSPTTAIIGIPRR